jgi:hypothetical protein
MKPYIKINLENNDIVNDMSQIDSIKNKEPKKNKLTNNPSTLDKEPKKIPMPEIGEKNLFKTNKNNI